MRLLLAARAMRRGCAASRHGIELTLAAVVVATTVAFVGSMRAQSAGNAVIAKLFSTTTKDLGTLPRGTVASHRFVLKNTTRHEIRLESMRSTCQCASAVADRFVVKSGEELAIAVTYETAGFAGQRDITIYAAFNAPVLETVPLRVSGHSRQDVILDPGSADFGAVRSGEQPSKRLRLEYAGVNDWKVTSVIAGNWSAGAVVEKARGVGRIEYELVVRLKPDAPPGLVSDLIQLRTNDAETPVIRVEVAAEVRAPLFVTPQELDFGILAVGRKLTKRVVVKAERPVAIAGASFQDNGLSVQSTDGVRTAHIVEVSFTPTKAGKLDEQLTIRLEPGGLRLTVRVQATTNGAAP